MLSRMSLLDRVVRSASLAFVAVTLTMATAVAGEHSSKESAAREKEHITELERAVAANDYPAALELIRLYEEGVSYCESPWFTLPGLNVSGGGRNCTVRSLVRPDRSKQMSLLEKLAALGDRWAMVKLAWLQAHMYSEGGTLFPRQGWPAVGVPWDDGQRESTLARQLYRKAAEPAADILGGNVRAVYADNSVVPVALQERYLESQYITVAIALQQSALFDAGAPGGQDWDWSRAYHEYGLLQAMVTAESFKKTQGSDFAEARDYAIIESNSLLAQGGHGLPADCPRALQELLEHADAFPDTWSQKITDVELNKAYGHLQSAIGLIYYRGCPGQAVDRDEAYAWFDRAVPRNPASFMPYTPTNNRHDFTEPALLAWAELLDHGTPKHPPRPEEAFDAYWIVKNPEGPVLVRIAQMIEAGRKYSSVEPARAQLFYCRAAREHAEPTATQWLREHPDVSCNK